MAKKSASSGYNNIIAEIRQNKYAPVYLLMGDEDYYIDKIVDLLEAIVVPEEEKDFNSTIFYGADADIKQVIARAQQYPVMAERQIVFLKEAQSLNAAKSQLEKLIPYIQHPNNTTVFVITYKGESLASNSSLVKSISSSGGVVFKSDRLRDYQLQGPVADYCREKGLFIDDKTVSILCEYIGNPLSKLFGEIDKLGVAAGGSRRISPELVESIIGISKDYNTFELIKAISLRDYSSSMRILNHFAKNPRQNPGIIITSTLFNYFSKLFMASVLKDKSDIAVMEELELKSSFALTDYRNGLRNYRAATIDAILHAIREQDAKSKGIGSLQNEYDLLKELIFKIFTLR